MDLSEKQLWSGHLNDPGYLIYVYERTFEPDGSLNFRENILYESVREYSSKEDLYQQIFYEIPVPSCGKVSTQPQRNPVWWYCYYYYYYVIDFRLLSSLSLTVLPS